MRRVLIYINTLNASGGIERVVANLINLWVKEYELFLLTKDEPGYSYYELPEGIKWETTGTPIHLDMNNRSQRIFAIGLNTLNSVHRLKRVIKKINPDYIYTTTPINSLEIYLSNRSLSKKLVVSEHASAFAVNNIYDKARIMV